MINEIPTKTYYDFCSWNRWGLIFQWLKQSLKNVDVHFYWDRKQKVWCRRIDYVRGSIINGWFIPDPGQIVSYNQKDLDN